MVTQWSILVIFDCVFSSSKYPTSISKISFVHTKNVCIFSPPTIFLPHKKTSHFTQNISIFLKLFTKFLSLLPKKDFFPFWKSLCHKYLSLFIIYLKKHIKFQYLSPRNSGPFIILTKNLFDLKMILTTKHVAPKMLSPTFLNHKKVYP